MTNITVIDALAAGIPQVFADPHQIQQVLLNLVINAEQAMLTANGRGTLVVRTWQDFERESIVLEVNDDGPGVPEEVKTKIFDPFFTTKEVGKGTGLGLTVAYAIVQEHGGRMWLDVGGRRRRVVLRRAAGGRREAEGGRAGRARRARAAAARRSSGAGEIGGRPRDVPAARSRRSTRARSGAASRRRPTRWSAAAPRRRRACRWSARPGAGAPRLDSPAVLIVEDETALASAMVESFTDAGFLVDRAGDGEEALARLEGGHYDLIISDLKMPRMDGIQLFGALRERHPEMAGRIMFVTGDVIGTDAERFLAESGCRWLAKPFRLNELLRIANEVMGVVRARQRHAAVRRPRRCPCRADFPDRQSGPSAPCGSAPCGPPVRRASRRGCDASLFNLHRTASKRSSTLSRTGHRPCRTGASTAVNRVVDLVQPRVDLVQPGIAPCPTGHQPRRTARRPRRMPIGQRPNSRVDRVGPLVVYRIARRCA